MTCADEATGVKTREGETLNGRLKTVCWICCRVFKKARSLSGFGKHRNGWRGCNGAGRN